MGHGSYSQDIAHARRERPHAWTARDGVHPTLDPKAGPREVNNTTPIVVAMDVTRSRGDDTKRLYEQLPKLMDALRERDVAQNPGISFAAIGDATADRAPLQVGQFEADNRLDDVIANMWIEEGGGGTGQESYELAAWYYAGTDCVAQRKGSEQKGFFVFIGDEGFYPVVHGAHRAVLLGQEEVDVPASEAFAALQEKFHVFLIYPAKAMEDRKADIDAEIRKRVLAAGGQYDDVDVRVSLIWDNRNDLDLHVTCPSGEKIFFGHKHSACGGALDVDRNVRGETDTPVENVRWSKGTAPTGTYRVMVQNYAFHEQDHAPTPFRVEIEVDGELHYHEGTSAPNGETRAASNLQVASFAFDPAPAGDAATYDAYSDATVLGQWATVLPEGHILRLGDARHITSVLLGTLAIANGRDTPAGFREKLVADGLTAEAVDDVMSALAGVRPV
jgi:hypothetical protein